MNDQGLATAVIERIEVELEELKTLLHGRGINYSEMSDSTRESHRQGRHTNVDGSPDKRFKENREGPTGQGQVRKGDDARLKENRGAQLQEDHA